MFSKLRSTRWFHSLKDEVLGPCNRPCGTCPQKFGCINKRAWFQPVSPWLWFGLALSSAVPVFVSLYPSKFISLVAGDSTRVNIVEEEHVVEWFRDIFRRVGLRHPDQVQIAITDNIGPTSMGMDSSRGAVVFIPWELYALLLPDTTVSFSGLFDGTVSQLTPDIRHAILEKEGVLLPTQDQIRFIIGHEAAHLRHRHTRETTVIALFTALGTHFSLKTHHALARKWRLSQPWLWAVLVGASVASVVAALSWDQELQADATAAKTMHLENEAIELKKAQLEQGRLLHARGVKGVDSWGNDWRDLEHPPTWLQQHNLKRLKDHIQKKETAKKN